MEEPSLGRVVRVVVVRHGVKRRFKYQASVMKGLTECKRISKATAVVQNNAYLKPAETELNFPAS